MTGRHFMRVLLVAGAALAPMAVHAQSAAEAPGAAQDTAGDIVVTAQRRESTLQKVPLAVSAVTQETMQARGLLNVSDVLTVVPNATFSSNFADAKINIRGIGNNLTQTGSDPGVAINLDGVYLTRGSFGFGNMLDVDRIEILRGPQGTLFGRNATGGAVNITPKLPTKTFEAGVRVQAGFDPTNYLASGYVSGSLDTSGELTGRLALQKTYNRGFSTNGVDEGPDHLDGDDSWTGRAQLAWERADTELRLAVDYSKKDDNGYTFYTPSELRPDGTIAPQFLPPFNGVRGTPENWRAQANQGRHETRFLQTALHLDQQIGTGTLQGVVSYNHTRSLLIIDVDGSNVDLSSVDAVQKSDAFFGQLVYLSDSSKAFTFQFGVNGLSEDSDEDVDVPSLFLPVAYQNRFNLKTQSAAAFVDGEYHFNETLHAFAGGRINYDKKEASGTNNFLGAARDSDSWTSFTYRLGLSQEIAGGNVYLSYATGFKSGGYNGGAQSPAFAPEKNSNLELGVKTRLLDNRISLNAAIFRMKYDDLQVVSTGEVEQFVRNAAAATLKGAEIESTIKPVDFLRFELSGSYLDAKFDSFTSGDPSRPALGILDLSGNRLPNAPKWKASAGAYLTGDVGEWSGEIGGRYYWQARTYFSEFNLNLNSQQSVGRVDLTASIRSPDGKIRLSAFARNLTDERVASYGIANSPIAGGVINLAMDQGRLIGASVEFRF